MTETCEKDVKSQAIHPSVSLPVCLFSIYLDPNI